MAGRIVSGGPQRGTTLVEVLIALLLIAIGAVAVAPVMIQSMGRNAASVDVSRLGAEATTRMEILRATPFHLLTAGGSLASNVAGYSSTSDPSMDLRWQIVDGGGPTGVKTIRVVAIATRSVSGQAKSVRLTTLRAR